MTDGMINPSQPIIVAVALLCAAAMGFSIQHGGTCMVAAVRQVLNERRGGRALALLECSLWVLALGLVVTATGLRFDASPGYPLGLGVALGGALLGLGAWLNDACVFGSIARIGKGDWHFLLTPAGYFTGSLLHARLAGPFAIGFSSSPISGPVVVILLGLFGASLLLSLSQLISVPRSRSPVMSLWNYRHATIMIGITFVVLSVVAGPWTYTEALGKAAHGGALPNASNLSLFAALVAGAIVGGWRSATKVPFALHQALACLCGGALMGLGGSLVPGGNDNLILAGLPGLQPHAWLAIGTMVLTIAASLIASARWRSLRLAGSIGRVNRN